MQAEKMVVNHWILEKEKSGLLRSNPIVTTKDKGRTPKMMTPTEEGKIH